MYQPIVQFNWSHGCPFPYSNRHSKLIIASPTSLRADRQDKDAVVERFWGNYVDLVEADPANHGMDYVHCYLVVEKE